VNAVAVFCHPKRESLCGAALDRAVQALREAEIEAEVHDLYRSDFDPVLPEEELRRRYSFDPTVLAYQRAISRATLAIFIHPDWWGQPPALLKGWIDRVLRPGVAYEYEGGEFTEKRRVPLLNHVRGAVFITTDEESGSRRSLERLWTEEIFGFCGIQMRACDTIYDVRHTTYRQRQRWLAGVSTQVRNALSDEADPAGGE